VPRPEIAVRLRDRKITNIVQTSPDLVATGNVGCIAHAQIDPGASHDRTSRLRPWRANPGWPREPCRLNVISAAWPLGGATPGALVALTGAGRFQSTMVH
jgi:hypothetical protein